MKKFGLYEWSVITFFILVPSLAIMIELLFLNTEFSYDILLKWCSFSIVGLRLTSAGLKQVSMPEFTLSNIFGLTDKRAFPIIREIGFANICIGTLGLISLGAYSFRIPAAIAGGLYFGFAGFAHLFNKSRTKEELFPMITDLFALCVFVVVLLLKYFN